MSEITIEQLRELLSVYFNRPIDEIDTEELQDHYDEIMEQSKQTPYAGVHEEILKALNIELTTRRGS